MLTVPQIEQSVLTISLKYMQNKIWKINKWGGGGVQQKIQKLISKGELLFGTGEYFVDIWMHRCQLFCHNTEIYLNKYI